jgi:hypothetical protein
MEIIWIRGGSFVSYIGPVQDFIDRQIAADVAAGNTMGLEVEVRNAYDVFIRDSINAGDLGTSGGVLSQANSIMKATVPMCGARTLQGCLVPLVGPAPTRFGTAAGWNYNRKTGLAANGTNNYLSSNRNNNADPQNSSHNAVWVSTAHSLPVNGQYLGSGLGDPGVNNLAHSISPVITSFTRNRTATPFDSFRLALGLFGHSRNSASAYTARVNGVNTTINVVSATPQNAIIDVFRRGTGNYANGRLAFYSIGEHLSLTALDPRLTAMMNAIAAAIP